MKTNLLKLACNLVWASVGILAAAWGGCVVVDATNGCIDTFKTRNENQA